MRIRQKFTARTFITALDNVDFELFFFNSKLGLWQCTVLVSIFTSETLCKINHLLTQVVQVSLISNLSINLVLLSPKLMNHIMPRFVRKIYYPFFLPSGEKEGEEKRERTVQQMTLCDSSLWLSINMKRYIQWLQGGEGKYELTRIKVNFCLYLSHQGFLFLGQHSRTLQIYL